MTEATAPGLMLCDDLIFFCRVSGAARAAGVDGDIASELEAIQRQLFQ